ncbi:hypothetical protein Tco_1420638 [Tanacetum coccineum]
MIADEIEKLVEGVENAKKVEVNSSTLRQDDTQIIPSTRLKPRSDKESLEVEINAEVQPVNINEEEEESTEDDYELKRRDKGKHSKRQKTSEHGTFVFGESSSGQDFESEQGPSTSGHEYKFITMIVARRANGSIVSITESDYKNLNKNDIEDMYLLIVNHKVDDYVETGLLWSLSVFIKRIEKYKVFSIISEPVYGIIYKNRKKEKRVMRHQEVHKFCDAMLKRVLERLKIYNNDVKNRYVTPSLSNEDAEYLQLFEEEIEAS